MKLEKKWVNNLEVNINKKITDNKVKKKLDNKK